MVLAPTDRDPVLVRVRAGVYDTAYVAARALRAGTRLRPGDVREELRLRWGPPRGEAVSPPGHGWEVRRPLIVGDELIWPAVSSPPVVHAGAEVGKSASLMITDGDPLEIRTQVIEVFIDGRAAGVENNKHYRLYDKYRGRPRVTAAR